MSSSTSSPPQRVLTSGEAIAIYNGVATLAQSMTNFALRLEQMVWYDPDTALTEEQQATIHDMGMGSSIKIISSSKRPLPEALERAGLQSLEEEDEPGSSNEEQKNDDNSSTASSAAAVAEKKGPVPVKFLAHAITGMMQLDTNPEGTYLKNVDELKTQLDFSLSASFHEWAVDEFQYNGMQIEDFKTLSMLIPQLAHFPHLIDRIAFGLFNRAAGVAMYVETSPFWEFLSDEEQYFVAFYFMIRDMGIQLRETVGTAISCYSTDGLQPPVDTTPYPSASRTVELSSRAMMSLSPVGMFASVIANYCVSITGDRPAISPMELATVLPLIRMVAVYASEGEFHEFFEMRCEEIKGDKFLNSLRRLDYFCS